MPVSTLIVTPSQSFAITVQRAVLSFHIAAVGSEILNNFKL